MNDYDELLVALRRITRAIDLHSKRLQKETGLTTSQQLVLGAIDKLPNPTPGNIAREILLSQATITNIIGRLERNGLVSKEKTSKDRRSVCLALTDIGKHKLTEAPELLQSEFLARFRKLEDWEKHLLLGSVQRIAALMDAEEIDASPILTAGEVDSAA